MRIKAGTWLALSALLISATAWADPLTPGDRDYLQNQQQQRLQQDQQQRDALWQALSLSLRLRRAPM